MSPLIYAAFSGGVLVGVVAMYHLGLRIALVSTEQIIQEMIAKGKFNYLGVEYSCAPYPGIISDGK